MPPLRVIPFNFPEIFGISTWDIVWRGFYYSMFIRVLYNTGV